MFLALTLALSIFAQDTTTLSFNVDGIKVILRKNETNNIVAANLYLLGGSRQAPTGKAGIEPFLLNVAERGTTKYPRNLLRRKLSLLGTEINFSAGPDWTVGTVGATTTAFDSTWAIFADEVMSPSVLGADVEFIRSQTLSGLRQRRDDPDMLLDVLADSITYAGHPYGTEPGGTEKSIASITVADLRSYQKAAMVKSRMLLVVVGNIKRAKLEAMLRRTLARLPQGDYKWTLPPAVPLYNPFRESRAVIEKRALPTNYIMAYYPGPLASSRDAQVLRVALSVLEGELFNEIRVKRNLTYAVDAPFLDQASTVGGLYVTTTSPNQVLGLMREILDQLQTQNLTQEWVNTLVRQFTLNYFLENETNARQANFLARAELYQGDYRKGVGDEFVHSLEAITPEDIQRVARTYIRGMRFAYIGDPQALDRGLLEKF